MPIDRQRQKNPINQPGRWRKEGKVNEKDRKMKTHTRLQTKPPVSLKPHVPLPRRNPLLVNIKRRKPQRALPLERQNILQPRPMIRMLPLQLPMRVLLKIWRDARLQKTPPRLNQILEVIRTQRDTRIIADGRIARSRVELVDLVNEIAVPEDVVARLHRGDAYHALLHLQVRVEGVRGEELQVPRCGAGEGRGYVVEGLVLDKEGSEH